MARFVSRWADYFVVICEAFALAGWMCFCLAFGLENNNDEKLDSEDWEKPVEHFLWYQFAVGAGIAAIPFFLYSCSRKRKSYLAAALVLSAIALFASGATAQESGRFLRDCHQRDPVTGKTREGPGCQEDTYHNYALALFGSVSYSVFQVLALFFVAMTPTSTVLRISRDNDDDLRFTK